MASGFGFVRQPQRPAPDPRKVGQALLMQRMQADALPAAPRLGHASMAQFPPETLRPDRTWLDRPVMARPEQLARAEDGDAPEASLRRQGAVHAGGAGQTGTGSAPPGEPDYPVDEAAHHSAMNAAIGDALTRLGGGAMRPPDMSTARAARRREHLLHLGVTPFEAELLARSGGA